MDKRQKIGLAILLLGLILALAYWLYPRSPAVPVAPVPEPTVAGQTGLVVSGTTKPSATSPSTSKPVAAEAVASSPTLRYDQLRPLAKTFSERYLTFSTAGDSENLADTELMMTSAFAARTEAQIKVNRAQPPAADFFGVTSRAISLEVVAIDEAAGTAAMLVDLSRQERGNGGLLRTPYNQRLTIMFVLADGEWKIDDAILEAYKR
jgi:hypothetical protein